MTTAKTETTTEAPQAPRAFEQCGALWQRVDRNGKVYLGGNIEIGANKIKLLIFDYAADAASLTVKQRAEDGKHAEVGTLQRDTSEKTPLFYRGTLAIGGAELRVWVFVNKHKTAGDTRPDWQICVPGAGFIEPEPEPDSRAPASDKHPF